jgi:hypothetical protein
LDTPNHALRSNDLLASSLHFWWVALLRSSKDFGGFANKMASALMNV